MPNSTLTSSSKTFLPKLAVGFPTFSFLALIENLSFWLELLSLQHIPSSFAIAIKRVGTILFTSSVGFYHLKEDLSM